MTILVTGSCGFVGSRVVDRLRGLGQRVLGVDCLEPRVHTSMDKVHIDCAIQKCADTPYSYAAEAEVVIHLAAQVGVADSMQDPMRYVNDNTVDTAQFLESLVFPLSNAKKLHRIVVASSMSIYGDPQTSEPINEHHAPDPASVYGLTKYDQEVLCRLWGRVNGVEVSALRFWNIYGPGQALTNPYTGVLANFANWIIRDERPVVYEDGLQTRDFVYVDDVVDAVVMAALSEHDLMEVYNISTGKATTIKEAAYTMTHAMDRGYIEPDITGKVRYGDIRHCIGDNTRFRTLFPEWEPRPFVDGVLQYADWLRS